MAASLLLEIDLYTGALIAEIPLLRAHWAVSAALLSIAICLMVPVYYRFFTRWNTLHPIIQASAGIIVPDILLVLNFLPLEGMSLTRDAFVEEYCTTSAFTTVASILASNAGVMYLSYLTWRVIVHGQRTTNYKELIGIQVVGWAAGVALAGYYYSQDYLGIYLGLYCCTKEKHHLDIVIPVFITFGTAIGVMSVAKRGLQEGRGWRSVVSTVGRAR
jgi:hypothetical protein